MTKEDRERIESENKKMADKALRVLAGAFKETELKPEDTSPAALERGLVFIGLTGMIDPVRPEVDVYKRQPHNCIPAVQVRPDYLSRKK